MSRSIIHLFKTDGTLLENWEFSNGWGTAPVIWSALCEKHLFTSNMFEVHRFWDEGLDETLPDDDRLLLHMTYDRALLPRDEFQTAAALLQKWFPVGGARGVNHWPRVAELLLEHADNPEVLGIGLYATSVNDDPWCVTVQDEDGEMRSSLMDAREATVIHHRGE